MNLDFDEIEPMESSDKVRIPRNVPYMMLRTKGNCYMNQKAASLLGLNHEDLVRFFSTPDRKTWFIGNDPSKGSTVRKTSGMYNFCDVPNVRLFFESLGITGTKAFFFLGTQVQIIGAAQVPALFITPKPINEE